MALDITARITGDQQLVQGLAKLSGTDIPKAIKSGVRFAANAGRPALAKAIGGQYSLSAARIKQGISNPQFLAGGQTAIIRTSRKPITAMQFRPRQTGTGLSMSIFRGQRTVIKGAFLAKHKGLPFKRRGKERFPVDVIHGPSIHAIYTGGKHAQALQEASEARISERLESGIIRALKAASRGYGSSAG
jgi:hypothetical protein